MSHRRGGGAGAKPSAPAPALAALITLAGPRFEVTFARLAASVKAAVAEDALVRRSPAADADAGGCGAESGIRCPSGPPLTLVAEPLSAPPPPPPPVLLPDDLRPYICDGGGTGYGVRRDEAEKAEAADEVAVLALAARARADAALISEVEDAF